MHGFAAARRALFRFSAVESNPLMAYSLITMSTDTKQSPGIVKTITWILSFGALIVLALDSFGAFDQERPAPPGTENEMTTAEMVSAPDGKAYAISYIGEIWYIDGAVRRRVTGIPKDVSILELIATDNGNVYAADFNEIWHIVDGRATLVRAQGQRDF